MQQVCNELNYTFIDLIESYEENVSKFFSMNISENDLNGCQFQIETKK